MRGVDEIRSALLELNESTDPPGSMAAFFDEAGLDPRAVAFVASECVGAAAVELAGRPGPRGGRGTPEDAFMLGVAAGVLLERRRQVQRRDVCPECGAERVELVVVPGRFYCGRCGVAGPGPNEVAPAGAQLELGA